MSTGDDRRFAAMETHHAITVLLVDDQAIVGEQVRRMLAPEEDIVFHFCQDPAMALRMAQEVGPTVILQDLVMPEIDGLTLVKFFRAHQKLKDVPLIVLSSKEEATTKADAFAVGANDYLVKLPDRIELIARIRYHSKGYINLLERNEAYESLYRSRQALAAQLASAAEYVISILPPALDGGEVMTNWRFFPSAELGGDGLGYHWVDEEHFAIYLLDVCDHGVGPALLSVSALNVLRSQSLPSTDFRDPGAVLTALNETFQMEKQNNLYFTIWYGVFNKNTRELRYATAGHPPALLIAEGKEVIELITPNMFIGGMDGITYSSGSTRVGTASALYVFSDGAYEIKKTDGSMWSLQGLKEYILDSPKKGESEIETLYRYLQEMQGSNDLEDDFSMLKVEFLP